MEVYRTHNNLVAKYVHDDGSETAIKTTPVDSEGYGNVLNKYNIFISSSVGCPVKCKFCYLTVKKCPYYRLTAEEIVINVIDSLKSELEVNPNLRGMYTKLSWMGMGDAYLDLSILYEATVRIIAIILKEKLSLGIDGVDISTTLPKIHEGYIDYLTALSGFLWSAPLNPSRKYVKGSDKQPLRIFYSLHSAIEYTRNILIPVSERVDTAREYLKSLQAKKIPVIIHHMFFDQVNDTSIEVGALLEFLLHFNNIELRLLRFNKCTGTNFSESKRFDRIVKSLHKYHTNIKVQTSPGEEVSAACGQFLLSRIIK